jgi:hypothetical protein
MARINQQLLSALSTKSGLSSRQVYRLIEDKMRDTHLDRHLAAILVASDYGLNIGKYAKSEELAAIRGVKSFSNTATAGPSQASQVVKKIIRNSEPIILDLSFVVNSELRDILERDIAELNIARFQGLDKTAKTCMVLCGSIAEALLLEKLTQNLSGAIAVATALPPDKRPKNPNNLENWDLNEMVNVAVSLTPSLLPDDATTGAHQLRKWRNLIHPGRELKDTRNKRIQPTKERANNAISFLQFIAKELT